MECHPGEIRRTLYLDGKAVASTLCAALEEKLPVQPWHEDRFQRGLSADEYGSGVVVLATRETLDSEKRGAVHITVTIHGLDDDRFAQAQADWWSWWSSHVESAELAVA